MKHLNFHIEKVFTHKTETTDEKLAGYYLTIDNNEPKQSNPIGEVISTFMDIAMKSDRDTDGEGWKNKMNNNGNKDNKMFFPSDSELQSFIMETLLKF